MLRLARLDDFDFAQSHNLLLKKSQLQRLSNLSTWLSHLIHDVINIDRLTFVCRHETDVPPVKIRSDTQLIERREKYVEQRKEYAVM